MRRRGVLDRFPDVLSRAYDFDEATAFEEINDAWHIKRMKKVKEYPQKYPSWNVEKGLLYRYKRGDFIDPVSNRELSRKLVVPSEHRERVLTDAHYEISSGHLGIEKTYDRLLARSVA